MIALDTLGYNLFPQTRPEAPGFPRIDVVLCAKPTGVHFDPEKMHVPVATPDGEVRTELVRHPWTRETHAMQVVAGRITLEDRIEKRMSFFTLGGKLAIQSDDDQTICRLDSPAPIMELSLLRSVPEMLAEEIEALLAHRRAFWEGHPYEFDQRLIAAKPLELYAACLVTFRAAFARLPYHSIDTLTNRFTAFLGREIEALQNSSGMDLSHLTIDHII